jgi:hypothetical protein
MMDFLASRNGRWVRILAGTGMVMAGAASGTNRGRWVALAGLVPLLTGLLDVVPVAPLFGLPAQGEALRRKLGRLGEDSLLPPLRSAQAEHPTLLH